MIKPEDIQTIREIVMQELEHHEVAKHQPAEFPNTYNQLLEENRRLRHKVSELEGRLKASREITESYRSALLKELKLPE